MTSRGRTMTGVAAVALLGAALVLTPSVVNSYWLGLVTQGLIFALFAASLDLLVGYAGLHSMGHAAFFGIGGYATGLLTVKSGLDPLLAVSLAILGATVAGAAFGLIALRARGIAFLVITLALGQVVWGFAVKYSSFTGGSDGLVGIFRPVVFGVDLADPVTFYYVVATTVALCLGALSLLVRSPFGLALQGIRDSEARMQQLGYATTRYHLAAFAIAALFASVAGTLDTYYNEFVSPDVLYFTLSATALLMVIMGSRGTLWGPALFGLLIVILENVVSDYTERWITVLGLLYVITVIAAPDGFVRLAQRLVRKLWSRAAPRPEALRSIPEVTR